jgi:hypothetical protein
MNRQPAKRYNDYKPAEDHRTYNNNRGSMHEESVREPLTSIGRDDSINFKTCCDLEVCDCQEAEKYYQQSNRVDSRISTFNPEKHHFD